MRLPAIMRGAGVNGGRGRMRPDSMRAQPRRRIDRAAVAAQFEIQRRPALPAGIADAGDRVAAADLVADVAQQASL